MNTTSITYTSAGGSLGGQNISSCDLCGSLVNDTTSPAHTAWHRPPVESAQPALFGGDHV